VLKTTKASKGAPTAMPAPARVSYKIHVPDRPRLSSGKSLRRACKEFEIVFNEPGYQYVLDRYYKPFQAASAAASRATSSTSSTRSRTFSAGRRDWSPT